MSAAVARRTKDRAPRLKRIDLCYDDGQLHDGRCTAAFRQENGCKQPIIVEDKGNFALHDIPPVFIVSEPNKFLRCHLQIRYEKPNSFH